MNSLVYVNAFYLRRENLVLRPMKEYILIGNKKSFQFFFTVSYGATDLQLARTNKWETAWS